MDSGLPLALPAPGRSADAGRLVLTVERRFEPLAADWDALVDPAHPGATFRAYAWLAAWWRHAANPRRRAHLLVLRRAGRVAAILPLYEETGRLASTRLRFIGDGVVGSDYLGALARPEDAPTALGAFAANLASRRDVTLHLDGLADDDPFIQALAGARLAGPGAILPRYRCPYLPLDGTFEAYLASLPDGMGKQWHRRRKWLERQPGYRLEELRAPAEVARGLEALFALHRSRWALEGGSDAIATSSVEAFHRDAGAALARAGTARVFLLWAGGSPRAALYGFRQGGRFAYYQSGHDPAWRVRSVGTVLLGAIIERCFQDGLTEFDFLRGDEAYKRTFASAERHTVLVHVPAAGVRAWLDELGEGAMRRLSRAAKRALPNGAVRWVHATRRRARGGLGA